MGSKELCFIKHIGTFSTHTVPFEAAFLKIIIWVIPACYFIKYILHENPVTYMRLNSNVIRGWIWGTFLSILLGLRFVMEVYIVRNTSFNFNLHLNAYLNTVIIAGFAEEVVFRGFILKGLNKRFSFWKANIITAFYFYLFIIRLGFILVNFSIFGITFIFFCLDYFWAMFSKKQNLFGQLFCYIRFTIYL